MDAVKPKDSMEPSARARLRDTIAAFPGQPFAVVDGAHFDDVTALFRRERLFARSLFLDTANQDVQKAGPWLVALDQAPGATENVMDLVGDKPAVVYWSCRDGETVLWRHLRSINMVRIPTWAAEGDIEPRENILADSYETVMFRHWDPRVLAMLMPCLDAAQFSRILGPTEEMGFCVRKADLRRIVREIDWPLSPAGPLRFDDSQMKSFVNRRASASRMRIADFLREVSPAQTAALNESELLKHVENCEKTGIALGLTAEQDLGRWSYVMSRNNWQAENDRRFTDVLQNGRGDIKKRLFLMVQDIFEEATYGRRTI